MSDQQISPPKKRSRGAQPGNTNALRHGFYSRNLHQLELDDLDQVAGEDMDSEIALLRSLIRRTVELSDGVESLEVAIKLLNSIGMNAQHLSAIIYKRHMLAGNTDSRVAEALNDVLLRLRKEKFM